MHELLYEVWGVGLLYLATQNNVNIYIAWRNVNKRTMEVQGRVHADGMFIWPGCIEITVIRQTIDWK